MKKKLSFKESSDKHSSKKNFLVVGIGASTGGVKAFCVKPVDFEELEKILKNSIGDISYFPKTGENF